MTALVFYVLLGLMAVMLFFAIIIGEVRFLKH